MGDKIFVIGELKENELRTVSLEAIGAAKQINDNAEIVGILINNEQVESEANKMIDYGADRVITLTNEQLVHYTSDGYTQALMEIIHEESPSGLIMGHTSIGKDLTPRIASKLDVGLVSDVTAIELDDDQAVFTRPIYSGKAFEKKVLLSETMFFTIRPNNIKPLAPNTERTGDLEVRDVKIKDLRTVIKDVIRKTTTGIDMSEANVVVAGGRGVKSAEGFKPLYELAEVLGGAVGASRGACDAGYCDYSLQIGQTGKVVTPDLYIACGISGAIQHLAGMSNSKIIVAINKDPDATIFNIADYGIVGDLFEVIPKLIEEIKRVKSS